MKAPKCQICKVGEALFAMQHIAEETPTFTTLGSHYRGFKVTKTCDSCRKKITEGFSRVDKIRQSVNQP